jgi:pyrroline-5-carboxylate reductase
MKPGSEQAMKLGFLGTGALTTALVSGLRSRGVSHEIYLSPRSETTSAMLAARYPNIVRAQSNTSVTESSDLVFLAMRPTQVEAALEGVSFRKGQVVVSFVTGLSLQEIAILAPRSSVCRVLPLPTVEYGRGPIICYSTPHVVTDLFSQLGDVIPVDTEHELQALGCVSGFMSTYFELQQSLACWLEEQGVSRRNASVYVRSMFAGLANTAMHTPFEGQSELSARHETKGGLNERVRRHLREQGWFKEPTEPLERLQGLARSSLD